MSENENQNFLAEVPHGAESLVPKDSVSFGSVPHTSESFRTVPHHAESFRSVPKVSERKENHSLTVRDAARLFETAGVARTERSITNWCQPNRTGVARLDAYFDPNERKYFITQQSVDLAIAEERAKIAKLNEPSELFGMIPQPSESGTKSTSISETEGSHIKELERENLDLRITNRGKDMYIEQLKNERTEFIDQLLAVTHKVGVLETKLLQIESPARSQIGDSQNGTPTNN